MPREIEEGVAENRRSVSRIEGFGVNVATGVPPGQRPPGTDSSGDGGAGDDDGDDGGGGGLGGGTDPGARSVVTTGNVVELDVDADVYTRPLGDTLIIGHPDAAQAVGRGGIGDQRGAWTRVAGDDATGELTVGGRATVVDALAGSLTGIQALVLGTGAAAVQPGDTSLTAPAAEAFAWGQTDSPGVTRARGLIGFHQVETVTEVGIRSNDRLLARLTTEAVAPAADEEVRVDVTFDVRGDGIGNAVVTDAGEAAIAEAIRLPSEAVGLFELAIGSGTAAPATSDTGLDDEQARKRVARARDPASIRAETAFFRDEPTNQPLSITELGLFDTAGRLVYRSTVASIEKTSAFPFEAGAQFRII
jgi:hypothetical protein